MTEELRNKIEQAADEASQTYQREEKNLTHKSVYRNYRAGFVDGATFMWELLQAEPPEFDEKSARKESDESLETPDDHWSTPSFIYGARWQHNQSAAQIAALKLRIAELEKGKV